MTTQDGLAKCYFCKRIFKNKQAVKAHLKGCIAYRESMPRQGADKAMPKARSTVMPDFREQTGPRRMRLHSRQGLIQQGKNHMTRTNTMLAKLPSEVQAQEYDELHSHLDEDQILHDEDRWEEVRREREQQRQQVKQARIENGKRHAELRLKDVRGMGCIDRFLSVLDVEKALSCEITGDESQTELETIVDRILAPQVEEAERRADEDHRKKRKVELVKYGEVYARREIASIADIPPLERILVPRKVREELEDELDGSESEDEVEDLVNDTLDEALEDLD